MSTADTLMGLYRVLREALGHRRWWPGETPFEVMVGAVLTQRTNWRNVAKAVAALKAADMMSPRALADAVVDRVEVLVRPAGYYRQKAVRLKRLAGWLLEHGEGDVGSLARVPTDRLRQELLSLSGIGPETADSILLYALGRLTFVVDTYTKRVVVRHGLLDSTCTYDELKDLFEANLPADLDLYGDYHAQLVEVGKRCCRPRPVCGQCPVHPLLGDPLRDE